VNGPLLKLRSAAIGRDGRVLIEAVDLAIGPGELVVVLGRNGVGKSTLLATAIGDLPPLAGAVELCGRPPAAIPPRERARLVAVLPESEPLPYDFPVRSVVELGRYAHLGLFGRIGREDDAAIERAIATCAIGPLLERSINEISAGERQRVLLARALAQAPRLVLLDEPTAHLDPARQFAVMSILRERADREGLAVLAVLHDANLAGRFADRVALLADGRVLAQGAAREVLTAERLEATYGVRFRVLDDPGSSRPFVVVDGARPV
jgi:iron complex transport system ATP-binding protein